MFKLLAHHAATGISQSRLIQHDLDYVFIVFLLIYMLLGLLNFVNEASLNQPAVGSCTQVEASGSLNSPTACRQSFPHSLFPSLTGVR